MYDGKGPKNIRSDISDQEEDEESEGCPVSISKLKALYYVCILVLCRSLIERVWQTVTSIELRVKEL